MHLTLHFTYTLHMHLTRTPCMDFTYTIHTHTPHAHFTCTLCMQFTCTPHIHTPCAHFTYVLKTLSWTCVNQGDAEIFQLPVVERLFNVWQKSAVTGWKIRRWAFKYLDVVTQEQETQTWCHFVCMKDLKCSHCPSWVFTWIHNTHNMLKMY